MRKTGGTYQNSEQQQQPPSQPQPRYYSQQVNVIPLLLPDQFPTKPPSSRGIIGLESQQQQHPSIIKKRFQPYSSSQFHSHSLQQEQEAQIQFPRPSSLKPSSSGSRIPQYFHHQPKYVRVLEQYPTYPNASIEYDETKTKRDKYFNPGAGIDFDTKFEPENVHLKENTTTAKERKSRATTTNKLSDSEDGIHFIKKPSASRKSKEKPAASDDLENVSQLLLNKHNSNSYRAEYENRRRRRRRSSQTLLNAQLQTNNTKYESINNDCSSKNSNNDRNCNNKDYDDHDRVAHEKLILVKQRQSPRRKSKLGSKSPRPLGRISAAAGSTSTYHADSRRKEMERRPHTFTDISSADQTTKLTTAEKFELGLLIPVYDDDEPPVPPFTATTNPSRRRPHKTYKNKLGIGINDKNEVVTTGDKQTPTFVNHHPISKKLTNTIMEPIFVKTEKFDTTTVTDINNNDIIGSSSIIMDNNKMKVAEQSSRASTAILTKRNKKLDDTSSFVHKLKQVLQQTQSSETECIDPACVKCQELSKKIKSISLSSKNLQRQNGCLESLISQKRNLVEQLNKQVRCLIKENLQLAKGGMIPVGLGLASSNSINSTTQLQLLTPMGNNNSSLKATEVPQSSIMSQLANKQQQSPPLSALAKIRRVKTAATPKDQTQKILASSKSKSNSNVASAAHCLEDNNNEKQEEEQRIVQLQNKCQELESESSTLNTKIVNLQRFISDLLYTLNARGYESVTDYDGKSIDLFKCHGEHLLDLKGRDARLRVPAKRSSPQEALLKAVIGSQENLIQQLLGQLDNRMRENIGSRLALENSTLRSSSAGGAGPAGEAFETTNAVLECEILAICTLVEGACQRNPDLFPALREQYLHDNQGNNLASQYGGKHFVIDAVLERCHQRFCSSSPPSPRRRRHGHGGEKESVNPRSGTPIPYPSSNAMTSFSKFVKSPRGKSKPVPLAKIKSSSPSSSSKHRPNSRHPTGAASASLSPTSSSAASTSDNHASADNCLHQKSSKLDDAGTPIGRKRSKCMYCGLRFSPTATSEELEKHFQLHLTS